MADCRPADPGGQEARPPAGRQLGLLWGGVALALVILSPLSPYVVQGGPRCPFKTLTGIPCPSCGLTRAAVALAELDPLLALTHFPLQTIAWIAFLAGGWVAGALALSRRPLPQLPRRIPLWVKIAVLLVVLGNWAYCIVIGV